LVKLNQGTVGTRDQDRLSSPLKIYPNPASDQIRVQLVEPIDGAIEIIDLFGRLVATYPWRGDFGTYDVSALADGLYIVEIVQEGKQVFSDKFIVQH